MNANIADFVKNINDLFEEIDGLIVDYHYAKTNKAKREIKDRIKYRKNTVYLLYNAIIEENAFETMLEIMNKYYPELEDKISVELFNGFALENRLISMEN